MIIKTDAAGRPDGYRRRIEEAEHKHDANPVYKHKNM